jgi:hypothetical protein
LSTTLNKIDKLLLLVAKFVAADDAASAPNKTFRGCGQVFARHGSEYLCGKSSNWHGFCDACQTASIANRLDKQGKKKVLTSDRDKALKELKRYWKEGYNE